MTDARDPLGARVLAHGSLLTDSCVSGAFVWIR
jgi:hypothetical protein